MKSLTFVTLCVITLTVIFDSVVFAKDPTKHDHMRIAIGHLEAAKTAKAPLTSLQAARRELVKARANKAGQRRDAIEYVDEAIAYSRTGEKEPMIEKISKAISNVKSGIARSK